MATRCNIQIHAQTDEGIVEGPLLYKHYDGDPHSMNAIFGSMARKLGGGSVETIDAEKVAGVFVVESMHDNEPLVLPAACQHDDSEYDYDVYVSLDYVEVVCRGDGNEFHWVYER